MKTKFATHPHWPKVQEVVTTLNSHGHIAYLAGGCVRDFLMGRLPKDFDVATSALPDEVELLFEKTLAVGKQFGIIVIPGDGFQIEVATFRTDGPSQDGRHPTQVHFASASEDAARRDFTINSMFYDLKKDLVVDFWGGQSDIQNKILRTVGDPDQRFAEDYLRVVRAVRFACELGFSIDSATWTAVLKNRDKLVGKVSFERLRDELTKALVALMPEGTGGVAAAGMKFLLESGILGYVFAKDVFASFGWHPPKLPHPGRDWVWAWIFSNFILQDSAKSLSIISDISNAFRQIQLSNAQHSAQMQALKLLQVGLALTTSQNTSFGAPSPLGIYREGQVLLELDHPCREMMWSWWQVLGINVEYWQQKWHKLTGGGSCLPKPFLRGQDCQGLGLKSGPWIGELLGEGYLLQLENSLHNREQALTWLNEKVKKTT